MIVKKIIELLLALVYPIECVSCRSYGTLLCSACELQLNRHAFRVIERPTKHLDYVIVCADYRNALIQRLIKLYKFECVKSLAEPLAHILVRVARKFHELPSSTVMAIPLHKRRLRRRGFNQSELLAQLLAERLGAPCDNALKRTKHTGPQSRLSHDRRARNVTNVFTYSKVRSPKTVLLVDDIATTFSTLSSAASELRSHGARRVLAIVLARG